MYGKPLHPLSALTVATALGISASTSAAVPASHPDRAIAEARAAARPHSRAARVFAAVNANGLPVVIRVSHNGRTVLAAAATIPLRCEPGGDTFFLPLAFAQLPINSSGEFHANAEASEGEVTVTSSVSGRFNRAGSVVSSSWKMTLKAHGSTMDENCESGSVTFTAAR